MLLLNELEMLPPKQWCLCVDVGEAGGLQSMSDIVFSVVLFILQADLLLPRAAGNFGGGGRGGAFFFGCCCIIEP